MIFAGRIIPSGGKDDVLLHITVFDPAGFVDQIIPVPTCGMRYKMADDIRRIQKIYNEPAARLQHPVNFAQHLHLFFILLKIAE
ncbi:hypothetical protein D3C81_2067970 [compost metagenome]